MLKVSRKTGINNRPVTPEPPRRQRRRPNREQKFPNFWVIVPKLLKNPYKSAPYGGGGAQGRDTTIVVFQWVKGKVGKKIVHRSA